MIVVVWLVEGGCGLKLDAVHRPRYLGRLPLLIGPVIFPHRPAASSTHLLGAWAMLQFVRAYHYINNQEINSCDCGYHTAATNTSTNQQMLRCPHYQRRQDPDLYSAVHTYQLSF